MPHAKPQNSDNFFSDNSFNAEQLYELPLTELDLDLLENAIGTQEPEFAERAETEDPQIALDGPAALMRELDNSHFGARDPIFTAEHWNRCAAALREFKGCIDSENIVERSRLTEPDDQEDVRTDLDTLSSSLSRLIEKIEGVGKKTTRAA